jgi:hypothetical protein
MTTIEISGAGLPLTVLQQINNDLSSIQQFSYQANCNHSFENDICNNCGLEIVSW